MKRQTAHEVIWMNSSHVNTVFGLDRDEFDAVSWSRKHWQKLADSTAHSAFVSVSGFDVLGYVTFTQHKKRIHLTRVCVESMHRMCGVGRSLVDAVYRCGMANQNFTRITADSLQSDKPSTEFFRKLGFTAVSTHSGLFQNLSDKECETIFWEIRKDVTR